MKGKIVRRALRVIKYPTMKPIATSTSDFATLIRKGGIYVDKTGCFHRLISNEMNNLVFLARPRRFGKSLMITALKEIFSGRRELFEGLDISKTDWKWEKWPVIYFNFGDASSASMEDFKATVTPRIKSRLAEAGYTYDDSVPPNVNFGNAIDSLSKANGGNGVVVLIDEYDAPVSHALTDLNRAEAIRDWMGSFYQVMKDRTGAIRFLMMTGVSKFTKMSVFSCLKNIADISMDEEYATMLGYTEYIEDSFVSGITAVMPSILIRILWGGTPGGMKFCGGLRGIFEDSGICGS